MSADGFEGKVAIVTGGGSGIGEAVALALGRAGASVAVCDIDEAAAGAVADRIGASAIAVRADVSDMASVASMVSRVTDRFGRLDIAVNNAGIGGAGQPLADTDPAQFGTVIDVNLIGVWRCMRTQIPAMLASGGGVVVNMASALGLIARAHSSDYIAAKHGVIGLTKAAAVEYSALGVRVNAVCPGVIDTPLIRARADAAGIAALESLHPIGRLGQSTEVAEAVLWLASDRSSFVTGAAVAVDGGWTAH